MAYIYWGRPGGRAAGPPPPPAAGGGGGAGPPPPPRLYPSKWTPVNYVIICIYNTLALIFVLTHLSFTCVWDSAVATDLIPVTDPSLPVTS